MPSSPIDTFKGPYSAKHFAYTTKDCKGRWGDDPEIVPDLGVTLGPGADCHQECYKHFACTSYEQSAAGCKLYASVCTESDDPAPGTKYYLAAPHDKPIVKGGTCTHTPEASIDLAKVLECKALTSEVDCSAFSHCHWHRPIIKVRDSVDCGTLVETAPNPKSIIDAIGGPASTSATVEACNALCLRDYAASGCT